MSTLLHTELIERLPLRSQSIREAMLARISETMVAAKDLRDIPVSIVVRSRNNVAQLESLLNDIDIQSYNAEKEVVVVDTESSDGSRQLAKKLGATVVSLQQQTFSYPKALNAGFEAASNPWVFSFVDHSALTNSETLKVATHWNAHSDVAAAFGTVLPNANAKHNERWAAAAFLPSYFRTPAKAGQPRVGFMGANALTVRREAWEEVGKFDLAYGAGGKDGALGVAFLRAGHLVMQDPTLSVFHSHGVGPIDSLKQLLYWAALDKPQEFSRDKLATFRSDLG